MPDSEIDVLLVPGDSELQPGDWEWAQEARSLLRMLRSHDIDVKERSTPPAAGDKGAASEIIMALGSTGAIGAAIGVLRSWLNQRSTRTASLTIDIDGRKQSIDLRMAGMSEDAARAALLATLQQRQLADTADPEPADER